MSSEAPQNHDKKGAAVKGQKGREKNLGPKKKYYKLVVRKLPLTNYDQTNFQSDLTKFSEKLQLTPQNFRFEHFIRGKLSRQRGPVSGVGFFSTDEDTAKVVLTNSQQIPFYEGDMNQSDIFLALYQTTFKTKERVDKLIGTYESDPEYLAFVAREEAPPQKRVSAEVLLDQKAATAKAAHTSGTASSSSAANDPRQSALLRFLRERSENRRRVGKGGSAAVTKKSDKRASDRRESRKDKERKGRPRKEKEKEEDRREDRPKRVPKSVVEGVSSQSSAQPPAVKILTKVHFRQFIPAVYCHFIVS